jgi:hypothetical protein
MWNIRRRRSPPTETFIIYDESSSPGADDYLIRLRRTTRLKPTFKKIQPQAKR